MNINPLNVLVQCHWQGQHYMQAQILIKVWRQGNPCCNEGQLELNRPGTLFPPNNYLPGAGEPGSSLRYRTEYILIPLEEFLNRKLHQGRPAEAVSSMALYVLTGFL